MNIIEARDVSKAFSRRSRPKLLREHLKNQFQESHSHQLFYALRNVSFNVGPEEGVQIVGANGAGKSTLLSIIAGLASPDAGTVMVEGPVGALLDLGSGFHPDLTGMENLELNAALIGIRESRVKGLVDEIVAFAELEAFMEEPLRAYSAGMIMRLAFAVAIHLDPKVLIVDEFLGVGDPGFQQKCSKAIRDLRSTGTSLLCVSHAMEGMADLCSRAIWMHGGEILLDGEYGPTMAAYHDYIHFPDPGKLPIPRENG